MVDHGGMSMYRRGCRCFDCREAKTQENRNQYASRKQRLAADPSIRPHGVSSTYFMWGCRCDDCQAVIATPRTQRGSTVIPRQVRAPKGQDPRRAALLYKHGGNPWRNITPFGREWIDA